MSVDELKPLLRQALLRLSELSPASADSLAVESVLNYGGFVNRSFRITADDRRYHVKLTADGHSLRGLERWRALGDRLAEGYCAPSMRAWIELPEASFAGPLFEWIEGRQPSAVEGDLRNELVAVVRRLHADEDLGEELATLGATASSCRQAYLSTYHERFVEDLELLRAELPPFIDDGVVDWLTEQARALVAEVTTSEAFALPAEAPTHRDLWLDNLMVTADSRLYILDWDEMGLGDPMMDWAMLFGPSRARVRPAAEADVDDLALSTAERARYVVYARASLLDWIVDPLADWVVAAEEAEHGAAVRQSNRRVSTAALELYRELYS